MCSCCYSLLCFLQHTVVQIQLLSKVVNSILLKADAGECSVFMLLVQHLILHRVLTLRPQQWAVDWFLPPVAGFFLTFLIFYIFHRYLKTGLHESRCDVL